MITFFDNNIFADKQLFREVVEFAKENNLKVDFNQGLDIRLLDEEIARLLKTIRPISCWHFAFDSLSYENYVRDGIRMLKDAGINVRIKCLFCVYCDGEHDVDDAVKRCRLLKEWGTCAYTMVNIDNPQTVRVRALKRWGRPINLYACDYDEFLGSYKRRD